MGTVTEQQDEPARVEKIVAKYFRSRGANVQLHVLLAGHEIDLVVVERLPTGLPVRLVVEVKAYSRPVSLQAVQHFGLIASSLRGVADLFVLVSSGGFTNQARASADMLGLRLLELDDLSDPRRGPSSLSSPEEVRLSAPTARTKVFVSYSHSDRRALDRLLIHLRPLERSGSVDLWVDTKLNAGDSWREELDRAVRQARVAVLLVSADFLASDFIVDNELPPLLLRAKAEGARILSVILSACGFTRNSDLARLQAINDPARPLSSMSRGEREALWDTVAREIIQSTSPAP
jgi:hypothetical protein